MLGTYHRLGVHVWASDLEVIRRLRRKITRKARTAREHREARHKLYRAVLGVHHDAQALCSHFKI